MSVRSVLASLVTVCLVACGSDSLRRPAQPKIASPQAAAAPSKPERVVRPECLSYDTVVTLTGRLRRETHPGLPNYESVANGDEPETGFYLILDSPVCTNGFLEEPDRFPVDSTSRIQLVLRGEEEFARLRPSLGRRVSVSGTLYSRYTGHHHAPLLLWRIQGDDLPPESAEDSRTVSPDSGSESPRN